MTERTFVACAPAHEPPAIRGTRFGTCVLCRGAVHIAPSGQRMADDGVPVACVPCVFRMAVESDEPFVPQLPDDEQLAEMSRERGAPVTRAEVEQEIHAFADLVRRLQRARKILTARDAAEPKSDGQSGQPAGSGKASR